MHRHHTLHQSLTTPSYHMLGRETRRSSTLWFPKCPRRNRMRDRQRTWHYATYRGRRGLYLWIMGLLLLPLVDQAEKFTDKVVGISAGDTLNMVSSGMVQPVRY